MIDGGEKLLRRGLTVLDAAENPSYIVHAMESFRYVKSTVNEPAEREDLEVGKCDLGTMFAGGPTKSRIKGVAMLSCSRNFREAVKHFRSNNERRPRP